jgi:hypothetical protein
VATNAANPCGTSGGKPLPCGQPFRRGLNFFTPEVAVALIWAQRLVEARGAICLIVLDNRYVGKEVSGGTSLPAMGNCMRRASAGSKVS